MTFNHVERIVVGRTGGVQNFNGDVLKFLRERSLLNQHEMADIIGVTNMSIHNWETKKTRPTMKNIRKLAKYWSIDVGYFFQTKPAPGEEKPA